MTKIMVMMVSVGVLRGPARVAATDNDCGDKKITLPTAKPISIECYLSDGTAGSVTIVSAMWGGNCK